MRILTIVIGLLFLSGCSEYSGEGQKKGYIGQFGDLLIIAEKDVYQGSFKDSVELYFTEYVPATMPAQGQFDIFHRPPNLFDRDNKRYRNVVHIDVGDKLNNQEPNVVTTESQFAKGQLNVYFRAKTMEEMSTLLRNRYKDVLQLINDKELERKQNELRKKIDQQAADYIKEKKGYEIIIPKTYEVQLDSGNILWMTKYSSLAKKKQDINKLRDIIIQTYDYEFPEMLEWDSLMKKRDEFLKEVTYNYNNDTYRRHEDRFDPICRLIEGGENFKAEIRSEWKTQGVIEGGPSIQYIMLDYPNGRIIHAEASVFAPGSQKRELIRELEAIIKSIKPIRGVKS